MCLSLLSRVMLVCERKRRVGRRYGILGKLVVIIDKVAIGAAE